MSMTYETRQVGDVTVLDILGRIDMAVARSSAGEQRSLSEVIRNLAERGQTNIVLNLSYVSYVDSSGIGELVAAATTLRDSGGALKVVNPNALVGKVLSLTRLDRDVIEVMADEAAAIESFARPGISKAAKQNE